MVDPWVFIPLIIEGETGEFERFLSAHPPAGKKPLGQDSICGFFLRSPQPSPKVASDTSPRLRGSGVGFPWPREPPKPFLPLPPELDPREPILDLLLLCFALNQCHHLIHSSPPFRTDNEGEDT